MSTSTYKQLVNYFGTQAATADAIGVKQPTISGYVNGHWGMTLVVARRAEKATNGAIKAIDLCPALKLSA